MKQITPKPKPKTLLLASIISVALLVGLAVTAVLAAGDYQIRWWSTDGGGSLTYAGEKYLWFGSASRITAREVSRGAGYSLAGGYWGAPPYAARDNMIFIPIISSQSD